ncbi:response regulator [Yoonia sp.]|uniref:response regulator n=1 Tax=Yoonia sp. TaxID=2212373 RepID=UPI00358F956A
MLSQMKCKAGPERLVGGLAIAIATILTIAGLALVAYNYDGLKTSAEKFQFAASDNVTWTIVQIEVDYQNLRLALSHGLLSAERREPIDLNEIKQAFDIYYSRIDAGRFIYGAAFGTTLNGPGEILNQLAVAKIDIATDIDSWVSPTGNDLAAVLAKVDDSAEDVRNFTTKALQVLVADASVERQEHLAILNRYTTLLILVVGLLVGLLAISFVLQRRLKSRASETLRIADNLQRVIETSQDAVVIADAEGRILEYSKSAEEIFGYTTAEALGAKMETLFIPDRFKEAHRKGMQRYLETGHGKVVNSGRHVMQGCDKSGREFPAEVTIAASKDAYNNQIFIGIMRDISDLIANEVKLQKALETARCEILAKQRFLAVMSHEMRTPLQGVLATFDLLDDGLVTDEQIALIDLGKRSGMKALDQVNNTLELARLNEDMPVHKTEIINPAASLRNLVALLDPLLLQQGNTIDLVFYPDEGIEILSNKRMFNAIFENLLANANKFTKAGHLGVEMQANVRDDNQTDLTIRVQDNGVGIAQEDLNHIFEDFASGHADNGGTGLGLPIVKNATEKMGGEITVDSTVGVGSVFTFKCRFATAPPPNPSVLPIPPLRDDPHVNPTIDKPRPRILVVDDNEINLTLIGIMIKRLECDYESAEDGLLAVEKCRHRSYDLILMDLNMPNMNGLDATSAIQKLDTEQGPIVCITAQNNDETLTAVLQAGMTDLLTKPIRLEVLAELLQKKVLSAPFEKREQPASGATTTDRNVLNSSAIEDLVAELGQNYVDDILIQFTSALEIALLEASKHLQAGQNNDAAAVLHNAAGSAGMLGGIALSQTLIDLEDAARRGLLKNNDGSIHHCHILLEEFLEAARSVVVAQKDQEVAQIPQQT